MIWKYNFYHSCKHMTSYWIYGFIDHINTVPRFKIMSIWGSWLFDLRFMTFLCQLQTFTLVFSCIHITFYSLLNYLYFTPKKNPLTNKLLMSVSKNTEINRLVCFILELKLKSLCIKIQVLVSLCFLGTKTHT